MLFLFVIASPSGDTSANEGIGFLELFALAEDREKAIADLIPGTEDFYYYSALLAQQKGKLGAVAGLMEPWQKRHGETERFREVRNRQALLEYGENPEKSLAYLKKALGLAFNHQQEKLDSKPEFPTSLDSEKVSWDAFLKDAFRNTNSLNGVKEVGLDRLVRDEVPLNDGQRRELLQRLDYPDYDRLVGLIAADLRSKSSQGFGEFGIHRSLTLEQLNELVELSPQLASNQEFVKAKLARLRPTGDESMDRDSEVRDLYLSRLWEYVGDLDPAFNSLKANVLYQYLKAAQERAEYPRELFTNYLKLPRPMAYMEPKYLQDRNHRGFQVNLNEDFTEVTGWRPVNNDEQLVRDYLDHYFVEDENHNRFAPFIKESYLKQVFASTKLLNGIGDAEKWYSMLNPSQVQALKSRIEISFSPTNQVKFGASDEVNLEVRLKNVDELIVKIYEINSLNFYLDQEREINTDLNLDGLIANEEKTYRYSVAPIRLHAENFTFESMSGKRGVWVAEFIGNGISSRALIRKGKLQYLSQTSPGGEVVSVLKEDNSRVKDASVWFGGKKYDSDKNGFVLLPFSMTGTASVVLSDGDLASFTQIEMPQEHYRLDAGMLLEQETLLPGTESTIAIRPLLTLRGGQVPVGLLEEVRLVVSTVDQDGVDSKSEVDGFELFDDRESLHTFRVPTRLRKITVSLVGEIESVTNLGERIDCEFSRSFDVNGVSQIEQVADAYLSRMGDRFILEVLGKSGEPLADHAVNVQCRHRDFTRPLEFSLKTNGEGRVDLGTLAGIGQIECQGSGTPRRSWPITRDRQSIRERFHADEGAPVVIPVPDLGKKLLRSDFAIFELRDGKIVRDVFAKATVEPGAVRVVGLEPGDYKAILKSSGLTTAVKVTAAEQVDLGYALSSSRHLQLKGNGPIYVASLESGDEHIEIALANADLNTRVHVIATRFVPEFDPFSGLKPSGLPELIEITRGTNASLFVSGRDIGEEYRYILERRSSAKFPGNLLSRPGVILNPWELSDTNTSISDARKGDEYGREEEMKSAKRRKGAVEPLGVAAEAIAPNLSSSLDFLASQAFVVSNLRADENGKVLIKRDELGGRQHLHVIAVNAAETSYAQLALPEPENGTVFRDLRLSSTLDLDKSFTQRRNVTLLKKGQVLSIEDLRSAELETYDTLGQVFSILLAINPDPSLTTFRFVTDWPALDELEKRELYSEHACHELNFFLSQKDPEFFDSVVQPYLTNKKDKTFLDQYLIGSELAGFLAPWEFSQLNVVERILLGRRLGDAQRRQSEDHISSLHEMIPPDPQRDANYFRQALRGRRTDNQFAGAGVSGDMMADGFSDSSSALVSVLARSTGKQRQFSTRGLMERGAAASDPFAAPAAPAPAAMGFAFEADMSELRDRGRAQALFRKLESTKEWAENNYYHLPIEAQNGDLVQVNAFWNDFAGWDGKGDFYSREFPAASSNFTEMMFALSVLGLPFESDQHEFGVENNELTFTANSPVVIFHEEIEEAPTSDGETPILVSQNFFRSDDRHRYVDGQQLAKFVTDEFLTGVIYGGQVVVTNPTSSAHRLDLLVQIPEGAVPVGGSDYTRSYPLTLGPFSTEQHEVLFYFPESSGEKVFSVYPVQVARNEEIIASGEKAEFSVVDQLTRFDEASWEYLSQYGTEKEVLDYLASNNLMRLNLGRIAWRMRDNVDFFKKATRLVAERHAFNPVLWSYGLHHNLLPQAREYLKHREDFLQQCGSWIECDLVSLDPVERRWYQHLEYAPLVNARVHQLGRERKILNDRLHSQYDSLLDVLSYQPELDDEDRLVVAGYLFLQDRIEEGLAWLETVEGGALEEQLQYDYLTAYSSLYRDQPGRASQIAAKYGDYPVDRWRELFANVSNQVSEIQGVDPDSSGEDTREGQFESLSSSDPNFELSTEGREAKLSYRNLDSVTVNYYEMDLEFLFSSKPFVSGDSGQFSYIKPNFSEVREMDPDKDSLQFVVPEAFASKNVLVEVVAAGRSEAVAIYSNAIKVQLSENYGRLEVRHEESGDPLSKTYVKVYARMKGGEVKFFKDGYTDLRGKFDYVSLNTNELENVDELSLLVMSEEHGSLVREVDPPQR